MRPFTDLDARSLGAGWRVLRRHLRYAGVSPRKLWWIARRSWELLSGGEVRGVLQRHRLVEDFYRDYGEWIVQDERAAATRMCRLAQESARWPAQARFSVLVPVYRPDLALLTQAIRSVCEQPYAKWELCIVDDGSPDGDHLAWLDALVSREARVRWHRQPTNAGIAAATNAAIAMATGDYCLFLDQDDVLAPHALFDFAAAIAASPMADVLYADEDRVDMAGVRSRPVFKPDWDPEWLRSTNYVLHPVAVRTVLLNALRGLRLSLDGVQDWDLLLRIAEVVRPEAVVHIPRVLYHWREHRGSTAAAIYEKPGVVPAQERALRDALRRRGETASIEMAPGGWRIRYALPASPPLVSIVIPTRDRVDLLEECIEGLRAHTAYANWQAIVVDNGSTDAAALELIRSLASDRRFVIVRDERDFNYSALCNKGVSCAAGSIVVLQNNDVVPIHPDWLGELTSHALRAGVGLAGALLYYPNRTIQHAGVVLGLNGVADRPYLGYPRGFRGVDGRLGAVHSVTAMITACAAIRRDTYLQVGGMDEAFPVACNDLDLCLRLSRLGYRNILTPFAELVHAESASRGYHYGTAHARQEARDEARFLEKYAAALRCDPSYNANLTLKGPAYALARGPDDRAALVRRVAPSSRAA